MDIEKIYDLTLPITESMPIYPGDPTPRFERTASIAKGQPLNCSVLEIGCHVGTHLDVPLHFLEGGADVETFRPEQLIGPAQVIDLTAEPKITAACLRTVALEESRHLLLKTRNGGLLEKSEFRRDYVPLTPDAAEVLLAARPRSIGFDYYSLDAPDAEDYPVHRRLAREGVPVCVCLDLRDVPGGTYFYVCLPLRLPGADGSPVRAVLLKLKEKRTSAK